MNLFIFVFFLFFGIFGSGGHCEDVKNDLSATDENSFDFEHLEKLLEVYVKDRENFKKLLSKNTKRELMEGTARCKRQTGTICVTKKDVDELKGRVLIEDVQIDDIRGELKKLQQLVQLIRDQQLLLNVLNNMDKNITTIKNDGDNNRTTIIEDHLKNQLQMLNGTINHMFLKEHEDVTELKKEVKENLNQNNNKILKELTKQRKDIDLLKQMLIKINVSETNNNISTNATKLNSGNSSETILTAMPPKLMIGISDDDEEVVDLEELIKSETEGDMVQLPKRRESSTSSGVFAKFLKSLDSVEDDEDSEDLQLKVQKLEKELKKNKRNEQRMLKLLKMMKEIVDNEKTGDLEAKNCEKESKNIDDPGIEVELMKLQNAIDQLRPKEETASVDQIRHFQNALSKLLAEQKQPVPPPANQINQNNIESALRKILPTVLKEINQNNNNYDYYQQAPKPPQYPQKVFFKPYFMQPTFPNEMPPQVPEKEFVDQDYEYDQLEVPKNVQYRQNFFRPPSGSQQRNFQPAKEIPVAKNQPKFHVDQQKNQRVGGGDIIKNTVRQVNNHIDQLHDVISKLDQPIIDGQPKKDFNHYNSDAKMRHKRYVDDFEETDDDDDIGALFNRLTHHYDNVESDQHFSDGNLKNLHQKLLHLKNQLDNKVDRINRVDFEEPRYSTVYDSENSPKTIIDLKKRKKLDLFEKFVNLIADKILVATPILMKKLFGLSFDDDDYNNYGGDGYGLAKIFKSLGLFGYLPLAVMKILRVFSYIIGALRKNKFFKDFLVPILIIGVVAASIVFLIWWLNGDGEYKQNKYGIYPQYYNNYGPDQQYYDNKIYQ